MIQLVSSPDPSYKGLGGYPVLTGIYAKCLIAGSASLDAFDISPVLSFDFFKDMRNDLFFHMIPEYFIRWSNFSMEMKYSKRDMRIYII